MLLQYGLVRYVSATNAMVGHSERNERNENEKKETSNTVFRNGNEKNMPIILVMTVRVSCGRNA